METIFKTEALKEHLSFLGEINKFKEEKLIEALKKLNIKIDIHLEEDKRFKSLIMEKRLNVETYYYNDGSIDGIKVISFKTIIKNNKTENPIYIVEIIKE